MNKKILNFIKHKYKVFSTHKNALLAILFFLLSVALYAILFFCGANIGSTIKEIILSLSIAMFTSSIIFLFDVITKRESIIEQVRYNISSFNEKSIKHINTLVLKDIITRNRIYNISNTLLDMYVDNTIHVLSSNIKDSDSIFIDTHKYEFKFNKYNSQITVQAVEYFIFDNKYDHGFYKNLIKSFEPHSDKINTIFLQSSETLSYHEISTVIGLKDYVEKKTDITINEIKIIYHNETLDMYTANSTNVYIFKNQYHSHKFLADIEFLDGIKTNFFMNCMFYNSIELINNLIEIKKTKKDNLTTYMNENSHVEFNNNKISIKLFDKGGIITAKDSFLIEFLQ